MKVTQKSPQIIPPKKQTPKEKQKQVKKQDSMWGKLVNGIVRPPRAVYNEKNLGAKNFILNQIQYERIDKIIQHDSKSINLTIYEPSNKGEWIILYLHGNSSSRFESTSIIRFLPFRFSLAAFDFIGCGQNKEAEIISLGIRQSQQAETVVKHLQKMGYKVVLWGRSMGAATALLHGKTPVIVADSSFKSFKGLCKQVAKQNSPCCLPNCLISCLFPCVFCKLRSDIQEVGDYDVDKLDICEAVKRINPGIAVLFISGDKDKLIDKRNSQKLYNRFPGKKKYLQIFQGNHNSKRPQKTLRNVMEYVQKYTKQYDQKMKQLSTRTKLAPNQLYEIQD